MRWSVLACAALAAIPFLGLTVPAAARTSTARNPVVERTQAEILAADRAFSVRAGEVGFSRALGEVMDPQDGLQFDAGADPVRGATAVAAHMKPFDGAGRISWAPAEAFAAQAGDMGVTWGRWRIQPPTADKKPITGRYVTVWRKDDTGRWKGLIDIGNPD